jgi:hypothetical protein
MLKMNPSQSDRYFLVGLDAAGKPGVILLDGQSNLVTSSDPSTVVVTPDASPAPTDVAYTLPDGTLVPAGTATLASGTVKAASPPAQENVAITITSHLQNADGSPVNDDTGAPIADVSDTVTIVPGLLHKEGFLFGTPA